MMTIGELKPGDKAKVCGFNPGDRVYRQRLLAMGLTPNTQFEVIRRAPLGDPIEIRVYSSYLSLRQAEAVLLKVQRVFDE